jgi:hypothetical protein
METTSIEGTAKTPSVNFNPDKGILEIKGRSIPENSLEFYHPILEWLKAYAQAPQKETKVNIQLEYLNTSSSKCLVDVFHKLQLIADAGNEVKINWYYEEDDEDMLETGEDFEDILKLPFTFIEIKD